MGINVTDAAIALVVTSAASAAVMFSAFGTQHPVAAIVVGAIGPVAMGVVIAGVTEGPKYLGLCLGRLAFSLTPSLANRLRSRGFRIRRRGALVYMIAGGAAPRSLGRWNVIHEDTYRELDAAHSELSDPDVFRRLANGHVRDTPRPPCV